jgi:hypothetical protein
MEYGSERPQAEAPTVLATLGHHEHRTRTRRASGTAPSVVIVSTLSFNCPWCRGRHEHGAPGMRAGEQTHRVSHCSAPGAPKSYYLLAVDGGGRP